jgi:hypothetical protein
MAGVFVGCPSAQKSVIRRDEVVEVCGAGEACSPETADDAAKVTLRNSPFGCAAGRRGSVRFLLEDQDIVTLSPGQSREFKLPRGIAEFVVEEGGERVAQRVVVDGPRPHEVLAGCGISSFAHMALRPLAIVRENGASGCAAVRVRASGLEFEVGGGEAQTLFVPAGQHVLKIGDSTQTVYVGSEGAVVEGPRCE